jgi:methylmalonyl-CoA/ethylmalonyl-CoA epimerase
MSTIRLDHIAIALERLEDAPAVLVGRLGGIPAFGAVSKGFRFGQWRFAGGGRLEVLEPYGEDGFLHRFLVRHGPGIHHVTFKVPDLEEVCRRAAGYGYTIVGRDDSFPAWKEAFLHPRQALGIVVQLAESAGRGDGSGGAAGPRRLVPPPGPPDPPEPVRLVGLHLRARSAARARLQWGEILGGEARRGGSDDELVFGWRGSPLALTIHVDPAAEEGPTSIEIASDRTIAGTGARDPILGVVLVQGHRTSSG